MNWYDCVDIEVIDDDGNIIYDGPKFIRCTYVADCGFVVTQGYLQEHGCCYCGGRKFAPARVIKPEERERLLSDETPKTEWEAMMIGDDSI